MWSSLETLSLWVGLEKTQYNTSHNSYPGCRGAHTAYLRKSHASTIHFRMHILWFNDNMLLGISADEHTYVCTYVHVHTVCHTKHWQKTNWIKTTTVTCFAVKFTEHNSSKPSFAYVRISCIAPTHTTAALTTSNRESLGTTTSSAKCFHSQSRVFQCITLHVCTVHTIVCTNMSQETFVIHLHTCHYGNPQMPEWQGASFSTHSAGGYTSESLCGSPHKLHSLSLSTPNYQRSNHFIPVEHCHVLDLAQEPSQSLTTS